MLLSKPCLNSLEELFSQITNQVSNHLWYLYNYYMVCVLSSHAYHVTNHVTFCHVTVTMWHLWCDTFLHSLLCSKSKIKEKEKKRNINNDLAILPSHDTLSFSLMLLSLPHVFLLSSLQILLLSQIFSSFSSQILCVGLIHYLPWMVILLY